MIQKKFDKTSSTISRVLKSVGMGYFIFIHIMPKPVDPDKMKIEENFDIYDLRRSRKIKKDTTDKPQKKSSTMGEIARLSQKKSYTRNSAVAKSVRKRADSFPDVLIRKSTKVCLKEIFQLMKCYTLNRLMSSVKECISHIYFAEKIIKR